MTTTAERDALIAAHLPFAERIAARFARSYHQDRDECKSIAALTLVEVASRADEIDHFLTYVRTAIWSRLIDQVKRHPILGTYVHRAHALYRAYRAAESEHPGETMTQIAKRIGSTYDAVSNAIVLIESQARNFSTVVPLDETSFVGTLRSGDPLPEDRVVLQEIREIVNDAIAELDAAERDAVLSIVENNGGEIARRSGVSRQRIGQRRANGLRNLAANPRIAALRVVA